MSDRLIYRTLQPEDLSQMHRSFIEAFSAYQVEMKMTREAFEDRMLHKLNIDFNVSPGVFSGDKLVAFIFQTINDYEGHKTAYNGGTGVIPGYLGQNLTAKMYKFIQPKLKELGVQKCVLEVLEENIAAIKAYEKSGFEKTKTFQCMMLKEGKLAYQPSQSFELKEVSKLNTKAYTRLGEIEPSMLDQLSQVKYHLKREAIIECHQNSNLLGYIIFQPYNGRITQLAVNKEDRRKGVGARLVAEAFGQSESKTLSVLNIETHQIGLINFFENLGFACDLKQFEMQRSI